MGASAKRKQAIQAAAQRAATSAIRRVKETPVVVSLPLPPPSPFGYFDRIYVINLDSETQRLEQMGARLARLGVAFERFAALPTTPEQIPADKPNLKPGHFAAARSHRAVLQKASEGGFERILIFEDDVLFRDDMSEQLAHLLPQLRSVPWDMFYLGLDLREDGGMISENLGRVGRSFHAHAYAVHRRAIPQLIQCIDEAIKQPFNFDCYPNSDLLKVYAKPILAIQQPNHSQILDEFIDRSDQYFPPFDREDFLAHCQEARELYDDGLAHRTVEALIARAKVFHQSKKLSAAQKLYQKALELDPDHPEALHYLGLLYHQRDKGAAAVEMMYRAVAARPDSSEYHCNLGMVLGKAGRHKEALEVLDRAIELKPNSSEAHDNRGAVLERLGKLDQAMEAWRKAIELQPTATVARNHLARALVGKDQADEAMLYVQEAIRLNPKYSEAYNTLGCVHRKKSDLEAAVAAFRKSIHLCAGIPEPLANLGTVLNDLGRAHEGVVHLQKAVELRPDYAEAHWNLSMALLGCGDFDRGWLEYEWRLRVHPDKVPNRKFPQPPWTGLSLAGRTILVVSEQGLGDTIQFVRYASLLAERGAKVILECQSPIQELMRSVKGISQIVTVGDRFPAFDTHVRLLSLPGMLQTRLGNIPNAVPYIHPDPQREADWKRRMQGPGFKVGIAWQGTPTFASDATRSIPLSKFAPLASIEGVRLLSLQKNKGAEQIAEVEGQFHVEQFDPPLDEGTGAFMDTAAVMKHLDLVITSDTAIAHLAGALGVRVWLGLRFAPDWRWLRDREDSPWYPTMRLFRQHSMGDWDEVFERMARALRDTVNSRADEEAEPVLTPTAPAELLDRLTILQIKNQKLSDPNKLRSVRTELEALTAVRERALPRSDQLDELVRELRRTNETLWQVEDDIRAADDAGDFGPSFVELARTVYRTNDRRSELKRKINALLGSKLRDEKQYKSYRN